MLQISSSGKHEDSNKWLFVSSSVVLRLFTDINFGYKRSRQQSRKINGILLLHLASGRAFWESSIQLDVYPGKRKQKNWEVLRKSCDNDLRLQILI